MLLFLHITGSVALLLLGVRYLRKGLDRLFGQRLASWMRRVGEHRGLAFVSGVGAGALAPSSTTMSVLAVQMVQSGEMTARQMLAVMLGANVGLTVLVQLVALRLDEYALGFVLVGFVLFQYTGGSRSRGVGQVLLALGLFFLAMFLIKDSVAAQQVGRGGDLRQIIQIAERHPVALVLLAAIMATLLQSATATIGVVIGLGAADAVNMSAAVPVVIGANVGLAVTTLAVGWPQVESRRLGLANLALKLLVAGAALAVAPWIIERFAHGPGSFSSRVANLHTAFNLVQALIGLPMVGLIDALLRSAVPTPRAGASARFAPMFIHHGPIDSTALAVAQSLREIMRMSEIVRGMLSDVWLAMKTGNERLVREVSLRDNQVDLLDGEVKRFLTRTVKEELSPAEGVEQIRQLQYLTELETVGDIIDKNLSELVLKKIRLKAAFSPQGQTELDDVHARVTRNLLIAETAFATRDATLAQQLLRHKRELNELEQQLRDKHFARLNAGLAQSHETSAIHLDLLTHLKRINSSVTHVAYAILENSHRQDGRQPARPAGDEQSLDSAI